jgi:hypothetical protein
MAADQNVQIPEPSIADQIARAEAKVIATDALLRSHAAALSDAVHRNAKKAKGWRGALTATGMAAAGAGWWLFRGKERRQREQHATAALALASRLTPLRPADLKAATAKSAPKVGGLQAIARGAAALFFWWQRLRDLRARFAPPLQQASGRRRR